jgi:hypothetical protein
MLRSLFLAILFVSISFSVNAQAYVVENTIGFKAGKGNTATESYHYTSEGVYHTFIFAIDDKARSFYKWSDIKSIKAFEDHVKIYGDCLIDGKMYYNQFAKIYVEDEFIGPSVVMDFRRLKAFYTGVEDPSIPEIITYKEPTAEEKARLVKAGESYYNNFSIIDDTWPIGITVEELKKKQPVTSSWQLKFDQVANLQLLQPIGITFNEFSKKQFEGSFSQYKDLPVHAAIIKGNKVVGYQKILFFDKENNYGYKPLGLTAMDEKDDPFRMADDLDYKFGFERTLNKIKTSKYTYFKSSWKKNSKIVEWDRTHFLKERNGERINIHVHRVMYE